MIASAAVRAASEALQGWWEGDDPMKWRGVAIEGRRVTVLNLGGCSSLGLVIACRVRETSRCAIAASTSIS